MSNKYNKKLIDSAKISATNALKTASKRAGAKTAKAAGDLIGDEIANEITSHSKKTALENNEVFREKPEEKYISPEERQKIIDELRLS